MIGRSQDAVAEPSARRMLGHVQATPTVAPQLRRAGIAELPGKNALITGGSSGIGQAIAVRFAEHGANDVVRMAGEATQRLGGLDILINNAGIQLSHPSDELTSADFDRVVAVNLRGAFVCAREAINCS